MPSDGDDAGLSGRCYCGKARINCATGAQAVAYCHCSDCRRVTASILPAFAAVAEGDVAFHGLTDMPVSHAAGVERWFCRDCGSQMAARFTYLPGQIYLPLGVLEQAERLAPEVHCHAGAQMPWLHLEDGLPRCADSGRDVLLGAKP